MKKTLFIAVVLLGLASISSCEPESSIKDELAEQSKVDPGGTTDEAEDEPEDINDWLNKSTEQSKVDPGGTTDDAPGGILNIEE